MRNTLLAILELVLGAVILAAVVSILAAKVDLPLPVTIALEVVALTGLVVALIRRAEGDRAGAIADSTRAIQLDPNERRGLL